jgi:hypothetical protein
MPSIVISWAAAAAWLNSRAAAAGVPSLTRSTATPWPYAGRGLISYDERNFVVDSLPTGAGVNRAVYKGYRYTDKI